MSDDREIRAYALADDGLDAIVGVTRQWNAMDRPHTTAEIRDGVLAVIDRQLDHYGVTDEQERLGLALDMVVDLLSTAIQRLAQDAP